MLRYVMVSILILLIGLLVGSCADRQVEPGAFGPLDRDSLKLTDSIPLAYGDLIAVTTTEIYPGWAQLWFQKEDKTIVTVYLKYSSGKIKENALLIPRS